MLGKSSNHSLKLGQSIQKQRKTLGLTQQELGDLAGCGIAFIHLLENGKPTVRLDKALDVLHVLGLELHLQPGKEKISIHSTLK